MNENVIESTVFENEEVDNSSNVSTDVMDADTINDMNNYEIKVSLSEKIIGVLKAIWNVIIIPFKFIGSLFGKLFNKNNSEE